MNNKEVFEKTEKLLKKHNQGHLLAFWEQINPVQRQNLLAQIERLDFSEIDQWVAKYIKNPASAVESTDFTPAPFYSFTPAGQKQERNYSKAKELGGKLISAGKVAAFVVAGGQGTRLGFDGPKGNFPITPVKNKTLFEIFAEMLAAASERYRTACPWYIMASPMNCAEIKKIFRSNDYYGLNEKDVFIFQQDTLPSFNFDGEILLAEKDTIACAPDGHGGSLKALYKSGAVEDMKRRGVEFISYFQVDNPLINIFDPLFIGLHALDKAEMSSKAVIKTMPKEKVGNFALVDGRVTVIEYSDLPDELAGKRNPDGSLVFGLGSIAIHIINRDFVEKLNAGGFALPLHKAVKEIPHIDRQGNFVEPDRPNGVKLESFVFDALSLASKSIILETLRSEEFAPVKNDAGVDSVESAREMIVARSAAWLESAGVAVPRKPNGEADCLIEIAPSFALEKDDIKTKLSKIPEIKPMDRVYLA
ncbi:MAG: UDPGP type 1 family protein [Phycisphaerae bacterium]|nr:UDPGP type 1 family protein [Phycisphaerae bacterium]MDD5380397.1 UDPGP type 1 family protein [Phycisphaerae bacterium]